MRKISKYQQRFQQSRQASSPTDAAPAPLVDLDDPQLKKVIFMGRELASGYRYGPQDVVISITDTHAQPPEFFHSPKEVLHRAFHDYITAYDEHHHGHRWCRQEDGDAIVAFVMKHREASNIIVHCNMGQSRSKAAALAIAEATGRCVLHANRDGRIVVYRDDGDDGNQRVRMAVMSAFLDYEDAAAGKAEVE